MRDTTMDGAPGQRGPMWRSSPDDEQLEATPEAPRLPPLARRVLRTLILVLAYIVLEVGAKAVAVAQLLWLAWRGAPHPWLVRRGGELARFFHALWSYLSCETETPPWPFSPWPVDTPAAGAEASDEGGQLSR